MTKTNKNNVVPCTDCGCDIPEGEIYGAWDDYCKSCYYENEHDALDEYVDRDIIDLHNQCKDNLSGK